MAFTFTDQPKQAERKRRAQERRKAERERIRRERAERARQQREREEAYWRRSYSGNGFARASGIATQDKEMALEMINAGYRTLSRKHHPDAGGSHEKMVEVNRALEALRKIIGGQS